MVTTRTDIVKELGQAADKAPEDLSALLLEAADTILMLRELLVDQDGLWLERVQPEGHA
jgi:hypothetical protein